MIFNINRYVYDVTCLKHPDDDDADRVELGGSRDQQVEAGGEEDRGPEEPVGREPGGQEASGQLGHDVAPEERGVHVADGLRAPVELRWRGDVALLVGRVRHHLHRGHPHVAPDAEGYEEATGNKDCLGEPLAHTAAGTFWLHVLVDLAQGWPEVEIPCERFAFHQFNGNSSINEKAEVPSWRLALKL